MSVQGRGLVSGLLSLVLDQVLPPRCGVCGATGSLLCAPCAEALPRAEPPRCGLCWRRMGAATCLRCRTYGAPFEAIRAPFTYADGASRLVSGVKYAGLHALTAEMSAPMARCWREEGIAIDVVTPVPLHPRRERERGFNQSAYLARGVASALGLPFGESLVRRRRVTAPQARTQDDAERWANMLGAFSAIDDAPAGLRILLIDDVVTTRATLGACATALSDGGAAAVYGLAFAVAD